MSVYVDHGKIKYRRMIMCHMIADSLQELHTMADLIGIDRKWFQDKDTPHYDICQTKRAIAIKNGAIEADRKKTVELIHFWRAAKHFEFCDINPNNLTFMRAFKSGDTYRICESCYHRVEKAKFESTISSIKAGFFKMNHIEKYNHFYIGICFIWVGLLHLFPNVSGFDLLVSSITLWFGIRTMTM